MDYYVGQSGKRIISSLPLYLMIPIARDQESIGGSTPMGLAEKAYYGGVTDLRQISFDHCPSGIQVLVNGEQTIVSPLTPQEVSDLTRAFREAMNPN